jgi:signal transduction histidine kinase
MRRHLALLVAATTSVVLLAFLLPLAVLISRATTNNAVAEATARGQTLVTLVARGADDQLDSALADIHAAGFRASVQNPGAPLIGDRAAASSSSDVPSGAEVLRLPNGDALVRQPVARDTGTVVVSTLVPEQRLHSGVARAWFVLGVLGVVLVLLSLFVADRLARSMTSPISDLAHTAERIGQGDLTARVHPDGPQEVRDVGVALNRLAARIDELLTRERESVADLSHRLRTPITALRLDADGLLDSEERTRLGADVDDLSRQVDALIREARRPEREGVEARCDARAVVEDRVAFWQALAEDQGRSVTLTLPPSACPVRASAADLEAALDALLGNVVAHTDEGVGFSVSLEPLPGGGGVVVVADQGPGFSDDAVVERGQSRGGSTGLGLDIARRTAQASGGDVRLDRSPAGGARVMMRLGPPAEL